MNKMYKLLTSQNKEDVKIGLLLLYYKIKNGNFDISKIKEIKINNEIGQTFYHGLYNSEFSVNIGRDKVLYSEWKEPHYKHVIHAAKVTKREYINMEEKNE